MRAFPLGRRRGRNHHLWTRHPPCPARICRFITWEHPMLQGGRWICVLSAAWVTAAVACSRKQGSETGTLCCSNAGCQRGPFAPRAFAIAALSCRPRRAAALLDVNGNDLAQVQRFDTLTAQRIAPQASGQARFAKKSARCGARPCSIRPKLVGRRASTGRLERNRPASASP